MDEKLKPCPCCGGKAELRKYTGGASLAICTECGLQTPFLPALDAEYRWNRRVKHEDQESNLNESEGEQVSDYSKLIAALRGTDISEGCPCESERLCKDKDCIVYQAADAIEELQALSLSLVGKLEKWCATYPSADLLPVQAQMPKTGKWIPDADDIAWGNARVRMRCSVCNATAHSDDWTRKFVLSEYCPHCGAKMEVGE